MSLLMYEQRMLSPERVASLPVIMDPNALTSRVGVGANIRFTVAFSCPAPFLCRERSQECSGRETQFESKST